MTITEYLASEDLRQKVQKARSVLRIGGATGQIVITLDLKDDALRSGGVDVKISSSRIDAKQFVPE